MTTLTPEQQATMRAAVVSEARLWLGTPYHHLGDKIGAGVDCAMLLVRVFADTGIIPSIDPRPYSPQWHLNRDEERYLGWLTDYAEPTDTPQPGDVGLWRWRADRPFSHGAVLVDGDGRTGTVVHALRPARFVVAQRVDEQPLGNRPVQWFCLRALKGGV